ncbi:atpase family associated with various cellular activities domain-containing protein, partial [Cystoisospora suis]
MTQEEEPSSSSSSSDSSSSVGSKKAGEKGSGEGRQHSSSSASANLLDQFRECEKKFLLQAGLSHGRPTAFMLNDTQIIEESLLEDINALLSTGEVPGIFDPDTEDAILQDLLPLAKESNRELSKDAIFQFFYERVACNLHIVLCMSPVGSALRNRIQLFPSLLSCCTVDFFDVWGTDSLYEVGKDYFLSVSSLDHPASHHLSSSSSPTTTTPSKERGLGDGQGRTAGGGEEEEGERFSHPLKSPIEGGSPYDERIRTHADLCVKIHQQVIQSAAEFHEHLGRPVYITPKCFLDLINLATKLRYERKQELLRQRTLLSTGLYKLTQTNEEIKHLRKELEALEPVLQKKKEESEQLMATVESDKAAACIEQEKVSEERKAVEEKRQEIALLQAEAQREVDKAMPALDAAM